MVSNRGLGRSTGSEGIPVHHLCREKGSPVLKDIDDGIHFLDMHAPHVSNNARNCNQGSIRAYPFLTRLMVTGLIGALLTPYFRITIFRPGTRNNRYCEGENRPYYSLLGSGSTG